MYVYVAYRLKVRYCAKTRNKLAASECATDLFLFCFWNTHKFLVYGSNFVIIVICPSHFSAAANFNDVLFIRYCSAGLVFTNVF